MSTKTIQILKQLSEIFQEGTDVINQVKGSEPSALPRGGGGNEREIGGERSPEQQPQEKPPAEQQPLSSEAEVLYLRLLKHALVVKLQPEDYDNLIAMGDINSSNAPEARNILMAIIQNPKYEQLDLSSLR